MSTTEFTIKAGDRLPELEVLLLDADGNPIPLTGVYPDIFIVIAPCVAGRRIVDMQPVTAIEPLDSQGVAQVGVVTYAWKAGDTDVPGEYKLEVILSPNYSLADEKLMTLPGGGYGKVTIVPRL